MCSFAHELCDYGGPGQEGINHFHLLSQGRTRSILIASSPFYLTLDAMCFCIEHRQQRLHGGEVTVLWAGFSNSLDVRPVLAYYIHAEEGWWTGCDFLLQEHRIRKDLTPVHIQGPEDNAMTAHCYF